MNIALIKENAKNDLKTYKNQLLKVLLIILILQIIPELLDDFEILSSLEVIFTIALIPISHGIIVSTLKIVKNKGDEIDLEDAFIGIRRYKDLFPTYIIFKSISAIAYLLPAIIIIGTIIGTINNQNIDIMSIDYNNLTNIMIQYLINNPHYILLLIIIYLVFLAISAFIDGYMLAVPYLLEEYRITGFEAVKKSFNLMKRNIGNYLRLYLSFIPWILIFSTLRISSYIFLEFNYMTLISFFIGILELMTYRPILLLSQTILYKKIKEEQGLV